MNYKTILIISFFSTIFLCEGYSSGADSLTKSGGSVPVRKNLYLEVPNTVDKSERRPRVKEVPELSGNESSDTDDLKIPETPSVTRGRGGRILQSVNSQISDIRKKRSEARRKQNLTVIREESDSAVEDSEPEILPPPRTAPSAQKTKEEEERKFKDYAQKYVDDIESVTWESAEDKYQNLLYALGLNSKDNHWV